MKLLREKKTTKVVPVEAVVNPPKKGKKLPRKKPEPEPEENSSSEEEYEPTPPPVKRKRSTTVKAKPKKQVVVYSSSEDEVEVVKVSKPKPVSNTPANSEVSRILEALYSKYDNVDDDSEYDSEN